MKLKILSLNAWLLPARLSLHNGKRLDKIFGLIEELDPDVIMFQEVWDVSYLSEFHRKLKSYYCMAKPNWLFNEGGLLTFSKYPVIANRLYYFNPTKKYDWFEKKSKKGFLVTRIEFGDKEVDIVNTHLYAADNYKTQAHRNILINQYKLLEAFFEKSNRTTILSGDLNMDYPELNKFRKVFEIPNKKPIPTYLLNNMYSNRRMNNTKSKARQLDYFLYIENGQKIDFKMKVFDKQALSDHHPLYSEVTFS